MIWYSLQSEKQKNILYSTEDKAASFDDNISVTTYKWKPLRSVIRLYFLFTPIVCS
jgi:hypothetical protein